MCRFSEWNQHFGLIKMDFSFRYTNSLYINTSANTSNVSIFIYSKGIQETTKIILYYY